MIQMTIAEAFSVVRQASRTVGQSSLRWIAATMKAPKVPMPAASTGVATPEKITPSTTTISAIGADIFDRTRSFSTKEIRSSIGVGGPSSG